MRKFAYILLFLLLIVVAFSIEFVYKGRIDKVYYLPQIETYIRVYRPSLCKYGYVFLSKDSISLYTGEADFLKIYKSEVNSIRLVFNPLENNNFYIVDRWNNAHINQVNFNIKKIDREDTAFFRIGLVENRYRVPILKPAYVKISIDDYLREISLINDSTSHLKGILLSK